jgi:hypothetical protein
LAETTGPGIYSIARPNNVCMPCLPNDPRIIVQTQGVSISKNTSLIDIDSELIGIGRNLSDCPDRKYMPDRDASFHCGAQTGKVRNGCRNTDKLCIDNSQVVNFGDCFNPTEDTRLSNPPCTLRGTGWNRFEWLPHNPQERVTEPFDFMINSKILSKDNHRPCVPSPVSQFNVYPIPNNAPICETIVSVAQVPTMPPSVSWQRENIVLQY